MSWAYSEQLYDCHTQHIECVESYQDGLDYSQAYWEFSNKVMLAHLGFGSATRRSWSA